MARLVEWNGPRIVTKIQTAAAAAVREVTTEAAAAARGDHPTWNNVTGRAESSIQADPVTTTHEGARGAIRFGVDYGQFLETGQRSFAGDMTLHRAKDEHFRDVTKRIAERVR